MIAGDSEGIDTRDLLGFADAPEPIARLQRGEI
jgi:hypothetical protein